MMNDPSESRTRVSLLQRLAKTGATDQDSWREFVEIYGGRIYAWCLRGNLQEADARDVTQQVLLKLVNQMKRFAYDPQRSFRAWLFTVTRHALHDYRDELKRPGLGSGDSQVLAWIESAEGRDDLAQRLQEEFDREILEQAMEQARQRVAPHTWEAFRLTAIEGVAAAEVAQRLQMNVANVYKARSSVLQRLKEIRRELEREPDEPAPEPDEPSP